MAPVLSFEYWFGWVTDCFARKRTRDRDTRRSLIVLGVFWFFTGVEYAVILPSAWQFLQNLGATQKIWLSASISAFSFANFVFSPVYGRFADRHSTKTILIISGSFGFVGNLIYLLANDPYTNVEARFIAGMGAAAGSAIFAFIARVSKTPLDMNKNMGAVMTSRAVGLIVGPAFNFFLVRISWKMGSFEVDPYNSPGMLMMIVWVVCLACVVFWFKDEPKDEEFLVSNPEPIAPSIQTKQPSMDDSIVSTDTIDFDDYDDDEEALIAEQQPKCGDFCGMGVSVLLLIQFLNMFNQTAYETFVTPFTQHVFKWNQVNNSIVYMITAVLAISVYYAMTKTQRKYNVSDRLEILIGIVLQLIGFALFWAMPAHSNKELWKFAISSVVFVVGLPFVYIAPALQAKLTTRKAQGLGQGIRRSVMSAAQIIGPLWATLSGEYEGAIFWGGMLILTAISIVIMAVGWKSLHFQMPPNPLLTTPADHEKKPLLIADNTNGSSKDHGSINVPIE
eukprot:m.22897 g.22897  ORF g.22897 m.22897 type:complete len:506 (-) comp8912_c0_seq2:28-1545(-)